MKTTLIPLIMSLSVLVLLSAGFPAYALRMTEMPKTLQTTTGEPVMRTILLKLTLA
jgi:hypothetical protein